MASEKRKLRPYIAFQPRFRRLAKYVLSTVRKAELSNKRQWESAFRITNGSVRSRSPAVDTLEGNGWSDEGDEGGRTGKAVSLWVKRVVPGRDERGAAVECPQCRSPLERYEGTDDRPALFPPPTASVAERRDTRDHVGESFARKHPRNRQWIGSPESRLRPSISAAHGPDGVACRIGY